MNLKIVISALFFGCGSLCATSVVAEEAALLDCMRKYTELGVSPDLALGKCEEKTLSTCIKNLVGKNFVAQAISKEPEGFLIDLGNDQSRWLEGGGWEEMGCTAYQSGPNKVESSGGRGIFKIGKSTWKWWRQGICQTESLELSQPYDLNEAKLRCEISSSIRLNKTYKLA